MRKSQNFDLNLYEGTDIFNPLTTDVPNYEKIDAQMEKNYNLSVGKATELKTGTVHALTRENADCPMIHFTATSNFTSNDTFTVDGVQVSALLVDGSTLPTNCYIIGSEVICYLKGTLLTFFLSGSVSKDSEKLGGELPTYYSKQVDFEQLETTVTSMGGIVEKNSNDIIKINNSFEKTTVVYNYGGLTILVYGKVVHVNIYNATCDSNGRLTDANVLSNFKPINQEIGYLRYGGAATMGNITVTTNGDLILTANSGVSLNSQPYCFGSLTYIYELG